MEYGCGFMGDVNVLIEKIYREVVAIREKLEIIERMIVPEEEVGEEELNGIKKLKMEASKGEVTPWNDVKEKVRKLIR